MKGCFEMETQHESVLAKLFADAQKTSEHITISSDIGIRSPERAAICSWLETNGYIGNVSYHGKTQVGCYITNKTFEYFKDKT